MAVCGTRTQTVAHPSKSVKACSTERSAHRDDEERPGQPFPPAGASDIKVNVSLVGLRHALAGEEGSGYAYQLTTVKPWEGRYQQMGSAPNFQGGLITLCTCKHSMRAFKETEAWPGQWIAGFTSVGKQGWDRHYLIYLMRVEHGFESHADLWAWLAEKPGHWCKAADRNQFGDVYRPIDELRNIYDWRDYHGPAAGHPHSGPEQWHRDILDQTAQRKYHRPPALLVGDERMSFLWDRPTLYLPGTVARTKSITVPALLATLRQVSV